MPGLQIVGPAGEWIDVVPRASNLLMNVGDLLAMWTNDAWPSTLHRVVPPARDRQSIAFFVDPDDDTPVRCLDRFVDAAHPPTFDDTTAGDHIRRKIEASQPT